MFIEELILDGFKSCDNTILICTAFRYSVRTVLGPFDRQFNAITGLNGSGKSNVLDGICFVLGISNLSKVRAANLSELVYKQGQAGITKASVTIVFNNSDKSNGRSPVGFESHDQITVCRQVVIGGRNRYLLNGKTAQLQEVYNLFHSVQLNINNPHFLIMQGSITKVINMKPPEILGMIEEAAGTSMYESKKNLAIRTLERKALKVDEIDRIIKEEISPQLEKLQSEKAQFLAWSNLVKEADEIERFVASWEYRSLCGKLEGGGGQFDETQADLKRWTSAQSALKVSVGKGEEKCKSDIKSLEKQKAVHEQVERDLENEVQAGKRALVELETKLKDRESSLKANSGKQSKSKSSEAKLVRQIELKGAELERLANHFEELKSRVAQLDADLDVKQKAASDLSAGTSGVGGDVSLQQTLNTQKSALENFVSEIKTGHIKLKGLEARSKALRSRKAGGGSNPEFESLASEREAMFVRKSEIEKRVASINFNPARFAECGDLIKTNERKIEQLMERRTSANAGISHRLEFQFDPNSAGIDPNRQVKGMVAKLLQLKPEFGEKYLAALEILAGAKLFNVVVDSEQTCKALLRDGKMRRRVTLLPLDKIQGKKLSEFQVREALAIAAQLRGEALPAIEAVAFVDEVVKAVEYVFGTSFLCDDSEIGKRITFNPNLAENLRSKTITTDGDVYDPKGSLTGGSVESKGSQRILGAIFELQKICFDLLELQAQTEALQGERHRMLSHKDAFEKAAKELTQITHQLSLLESRLRSTSQAQLVDEMETIEAEIGTEKQRLDGLEGRKEELESSISALQKEMSDLLKNKEVRTRELAAQVVSGKKERKIAQEELRRAEVARSESEVALRSAEDDLRQFCEDAAAQSSLSSSLETEIAALEEKIQKLRDELEALGGKVRESKVAKTSFDKTVAALLSALDDEKRKLDEADVQVKKFESLMQALVRERSDAQLELATLEKEFVWLKEARKRILSDESIGAKSRGQVADLKGKLGELKDDVLIKGKSINRRILPLIERSEKEAVDLMAKRESLEKEKKSIHQFIEELDDKKGRALSKTWQIVNSNFGAIFRSLLPKVDAKLAPPEGLTALEGLELKVQLGSVWKDSLTELSGGQKSLLALSLVLALLLFKPAPFYILDEVDAALDISHTRNIGKMIKQYFPHSQFVIVSLKDGMFSNANVLFRVRFENGTSVVSRTEQAPTTSGGGVVIEFKENVPIEDEKRLAVVKTNKKVVAKNPIAADVLSDEDVPPPEKPRTKRKAARN